MKKLNRIFIEKFDTDLHSIKHLVYQMINGRQIEMKISVTISGT